MSSKIFLLSEWPLETLRSILDKQLLYLRTLSYPKADSLSEFQKSNPTAYLQIERCVLEQYHQLVCYYAGCFPINTWTRYNPDRPEKLFLPQLCLTEGFFGTTICLYIALNKLGLNKTASLLTDFITLTYSNPSTSISNSSSQQGNNNSTVQGQNVVINNIYNGTSPHTGSPPFSSNMDSRLKLWYELNNASTFSSIDYNLMSMVSNGEIMSLHQFRKRYPDEYLSIVTDSNNSTMFLTHYDIKMRNLMNVNIHSSQCDMFTAILNLLSERIQDDGSLLKLIYILLKTNNARVAQKIYEKVFNIQIPARIATPQTLSDSDSDRMITDDTLASQISQTNLNSKTGQQSLLSIAKKFTNIDVMRDISTDDEETRDMMVKISILPECDNKLKDFALDKKSIIQKMTFDKNKALEAINTQEEVLKKLKEDYKKLDSFLPMVIGQIAAKHIKNIFDRDYKEEMKKIEDDAKRALEGARIHKQQREEEKNKSVTASSDSVLASWLSFLPGSGSSK